MLTNMMDREGECVMTFALYHEELSSVNVANDHVHDYGKGDRPRSVRVYLEAYLPKLEMVSPSVVPRENLESR